MGNHRARIAELEAIMNRFYRDESLEDARTRLNAMVDEHNGLIEARNAEIAESEKTLDEELRPLNALEKEIEKADRNIKRKPSPTDRQAVREYNALVDRRNALVGRFNELNRTVKPKVEAHNSRIGKVKAELDSLRRRLEGERAKLHARLDEYERFHEAGKDVAFYRALNRLYGRLHEERRRAGGSPELYGLIEKLQGMRRELGRHAAERHRGSDHGLIIVQASLQSPEAEIAPCFFILDTGAMLTTIAPGVMEALGLSHQLGEEVELSLAAGRKAKGRECTLPRVTVAGRTEQNIAAAAVGVSEVGIDGLLGQSFLKRFTYTIDETKKEKLILKPRAQRRR